MCYDDIYISLQIENEYRNRFEIMVNLKMDVTYNSDQEWIAYFGIGESI